MKAFVINLKRNPERRAHMEKQLQALGIPFEFIDATDGQTLSPSELAVLYDKKTSLRYLKEPLRTNEIACAHSHTKAYHRVLEEDLPYALILEDDVVLDHRILNVLSEDFLAQSQFDWLQIDYPPVGLPFLKNWLRGSWHYTKQNPLFGFYVLIKAPYIIILSLFEAIREWHHKNNPHVVRFLRPLYLASAYVVTSTGAEKLLSLSEPILFAADMLPNKARIQKGLVMRAISPLLSHQDRTSFSSEIGIR